MRIRGLGAPTEGVAPTDRAVPETCLTGPVHRSMSENVAAPVRRRAPDRRKADLLLDPRDVPRARSRLPSSANDRSSPFTAPPGDQKLAFLVPVGFSPGLVREPPPGPTGWPLPYSPATRPSSRPGDERDRRGLLPVVGPNDHPVQEGGLRTEDLLGHPAGDGLVVHSAAWAAVHGVAASTCPLSTEQPGAGALWAA